MQNEIKYTIQVVFKEWLGLDYAFVEKEQNNIILLKDNKYIEFNCEIFYLLYSIWLEESINRYIKIEDLALSEFPGEIFDNIKRFGNIGINRIKELKIITTNSNNKTVEFKNDIYVKMKYDIFGIIFFMISRYEEKIVIERDERDRFSAKSSIAYKNKFLDRPVVNEHVELLWVLIITLWPNTIRKQRKYQMILTHDVDLPYKYYKQNILKIIKVLFANKRPLNVIFNDIKRWFEIICGNYIMDPYFKFDYLMEKSEEKQIRSKFYFISDHSFGKIDGNYSINEKNIIEVMKDINKRGHIIGIHYSYNSYLDIEQMKKEKCILENVLKKNGIISNIIESRQHYLRIKVPETLRNIDGTEIKIDSSLSYADHAGFRCGTCWEYPIYDLEKRNEMRIIEMPLIAMECSVIEKQYMNLGIGEKALNYFIKLKNQCKYYNGNFVILWHNSELDTEEKRLLYNQVLDN